MMAANCTCDGLVSPYLVWCSLPILLHEIGRLCQTITYLCIYSGFLGKGSAKDYSGAEILAPAKIYSDIPSCVHHLTMHTHVWPVNDGGGGGGGGGHVPCSDSCYVAHR